MKLDCESRERTTLDFTKRNFYKTYWKASYPKNVPLVRVYVKLTGHVRKWNGELGNGKVFP